MANIVKYVILGDTNFQGGLKLDPVNPVIVPIPEEGKKVLFLDSTNSNKLSVKDDAGIVVEAGAVRSVFGRTGVVAAQLGDYGADKITFDKSGSTLDSTNVDGALKELDGGVVNTDADVNPALPRVTYFVDCTSAERYFKLPDVTAANDGRVYRVYKVADTHDLVVTTVGGTQLVGGQVTQVMNQTDTGITVQANFDCLCYEIIQDSRAKSPTSALNFYATTTDSDIAGYKVHVTSSSDLRYDETEVDVSSGAITGTGQLITSFISDPGAIRGVLPETNATTTGSVRKSSGTGSAQFYVAYYKRTAAGVETLLGTSSSTIAVTSATYVEFTASGVVDTTLFEATDRYVTKLYANRVGVGTDPVYLVKVGGSEPARTLIPIPSGSISHDSLGGVQQAADGVTSGHVKLFRKTFTSANSTGFVWADNVLTIAHNLNKSDAECTIFDSNGTPVGYTKTNTDANTTKINFPVASVPIAGTWIVKIW